MQLYTPQVKQELEAYIRFAPWLQGWHTSEHSASSPRAVRSVQYNILVRITSGKAQKSAAAFQKGGTAILMEKLPPSGSKWWSLSMVLCQYNCLYGVGKPTDMFSPSLPANTTFFCGQTMPDLSHILFLKIRSPVACQVLGSMSPACQVAWERRESHSARGCWGACHQIILPHRWAQLVPHSCCCGPPSQSKTHTEPFEHFTGHCTSAAQYIEIQHGFPH